MHQADNVYDKDVHPVWDVRPFTDLVEDDMPSERFWHCHSQLWQMLTPGKSPLPRPHATSLKYPMRLAAVPQRTAPAASWPRCPEHDAIHHHVVKEPNDLGRRREHTRGCGLIEDTGRDPYYTYMYVTVYSSTVRYGVHTRVFEYNQD